MAKFNPKQLNSQERMNLLDLLWTSINELKTREEIKNFFKDLLSESEAIMLARRILIAQELLQGKTYEEIIEKYKVGRSTLASVNSWLESGFGGYEKALKKFEKTLDERERKRKLAEEIDKKSNAPAMSFTWIRKKYPLHFLLLNWIIDKKRSPQINKLSGKRNKKKISN